MIGRCLVFGALALSIAASPVAADEDGAGGEPIYFRYAKHLSPELRDVFDRMVVYDRFMYPDDRDAMNSFAAAEIDLDGIEPPELAIPIFHGLMGNSLNMVVILARRTPDGWRFIGNVVASLDDRLLDGSPRENGFFEPALYLEKSTHKGWRVLSSGPRWEWLRLSGEIDAMGGVRYCWTDNPTHEFGEPDLDDAWGLLYDSGGPGYFDQVPIEEDCP